MRFLLVLLQQSDVSVWAVILLLWVHVLFPILFAATVAFSPACVHPRSPGSLHSNFANQCRLLDWTRAMAVFEAWPDRHAVDDVVRKYCAHGACCLKLWRMATVCLAEKRRLDVEDFEIHFLFHRFFAKSWMKL